MLCDCAVLFSIDSLSITIYVVFQQNCLCCFETIYIFSDTSMLLNVSLDVHVGTPVVIFAINSVGTTQASTPYRKEVLYIIYTVHPSGNAY
jgi:hypothetical protein